MIRSLPFAACGKFIAAAAALGMAVLSASAEQADPSKVEEQYLLEKAPKKAAEVIALRKEAKDGAEVVVVGRIGGRVNPWIKGAAAFSIVDRSLKPCNEIPGDTCKTPWDYCCEADLPKATLLVMVNGADGKLVKKDARQMLGVKELDTIVVQGRAKRDKSGNVSIVATKFYVASEDEKREIAK